MQVIVINSQKGGSGKTMLTKNLAIAAERAGDGPVYMIDTDPQGNLNAWYRRRDADKPAMIEVPFDKLSAALDVLRQKGARYCIIDTGSGRLEVARELFVHADFAILPVQPSEEDLIAAPVTVRAMKEAGVPFLFVLTRVKPNTLVTAQAAATLSKHGEIAETFVNDRTNYKSSFAKGETVIEAEPKGAAAKEIADLWRNVKACMQANMRTANHANMQERIETHA